MPLQNHLKLTRPQAEWIDWALSGPIADHDIDSLVYDKDIMPSVALQFLKDRDATFLHGNLLILQATTDGEFVSDLLDMLENVAPDVAGGYGFEEAAAQCRHSAEVVTFQRAQAAFNAANKIRTALGLSKT